MNSRGAVFRSLHPSPVRRCVTESQPFGPAAPYLLIGAIVRQSPKRKAAGRKPLTEVAETTHEGGLHRSLGIPENERIGAKRIEAATHSNDALTRKQANLAKTYAKYRKKG